MKYSKPKLFDFNLKRKIINSVCYTGNTAGDQDWPAAYCESGTNANGTCAVGTGNLGADSWCRDGNGNLNYDCNTGDSVFTDACFTGSNPLTCSGGSSFVG